MIAGFILDKSAFPHCFLVIRCPYLRGRPSFPSPGGEGRVRGLFLGMGEGQNNEVKPAPGKRMDFRRSKCCRWPCIMRSAIYPSPNSPTNSLEEAKLKTTAYGLQTQDSLSKTHWVCPEFVMISTPEGRRNFSSRSHTIRAHTTRPSQTGMPPGTRGRKGECRGKQENTPRSSRTARSHGFRIFEHSDSTR